MFIDYHHQYRIDTRIARIFNTYGPGLHENDGRVVSNFITQALRHDDLTIYGDGSQTRSFCYIDDLVDGLVKLFEYEGKDSYLPVNLGNPENVNMLELASLIIRLTESNSKIKFLPLPIDDPRQRTPDISRAMEVLDWEPRVDLVSGINETIDYFRHLNR
jgi:UDP-glucuronate decarboxylase